MKALISPNENYRVADVHEIGFDVSEPLFWVDCPDDTVADIFWYDQKDQTVKPPILLDADQPQPVADGVQEL
jgi:hypothetical protein